MRYLAAFCVLLSLAGAGCDGGILQPGVDAAAEQARRPVDGVEDLKGNVLVMLAPDGQDVVVALDGKGAPDGVAEQVFRLQRGVGSSSFATIPPGGLLLEGASLRYDRRRLHIQHDELSALLTLRDDVLRPVDRLRERVETSRWSGYGLARATGEWVMTTESLSAAAVRGFECGGRLSAGRFASYDPGDNDSAGDCSAGGPGTSGCSIAAAGFECSVSCMSGYYACCNVLGGCKCRAVT